MNSHGNRISRTSGKGRERRKNEAELFIKSEAQRQVPHVTPGSIGPAKMGTNKKTLDVL